MPIPIKPDVLVCGAGCAGLAAALAAARTGAQTLLIERAPFAGGIITCAGLPYFDGVARKKDGVIVTRGIPLELLARLGVCKVSDKTIPQHNVPINSIERFKVLADDLLQAEPNLRFLYYTLVVDAVMEGDRIREVVLANKGGLQRIEPGIVIDATGDADVAARAGAPLDEHQELMPLSLHFRIGNVTLKPDVGHVAPDTDQSGPGLTRGEVKSKRFSEVLQKAFDEGRIGSFYGPLISFRFAPNEANVHGTRVKADATDPEDLTRAEIQGRKDAWAMFELWKEQIPGFENSYYVGSGPYIGVRETRRIDGQYVLTEHDIQAERQFPDAVATGCWYMDLQPNYPTPGGGNAPVGSLQGLDGFQPAHYDIPYRSLLPRKVANLLVAGRCHSATRLAASSSRVTATAMAMGQAAGTAAALAVRARTTVQELDGRKVRDFLAQQGAGPYSDPR
jgi:2-polyprenyl-6-methoxyphenol hydroxylase-like FAD-dependent oxidoreductase